MKKLNGESMNIVDENIAKLKELFPDVFSEGKIDFEVLEATLGKYIDNNSERYNFNWNGKSTARRIAQTSSNGTLRPCKIESKDWDSTQNLYIEGDNLEVLKLLQKSYHKKVKMIYIDPPYNTGKDFVYKDNFRDNIKNYMQITGQVDSDGNRLSTNSETNGRYHSDWLNMMYPRLKLARNLLKDDGVIFISIDDNEVANLRKLCDEIFGEDNFVSQMPWQARQSIQNDTDLSSSHEYIVAYAKLRRQTNRRLKESNKQLWYQEKSFACYPIPLYKSKFSNPDNDPRGLWKADPFDAPNIRPNLTYPIANPNTNESHMPPNGRCWRTEEKNYKEWLSDNRIIFGKTGEGRPQLKVFYEEKKEFGSVSNTWLDGNTYGTATKGTKLLQTLFQNAPFDTPKPIELIQQLMLIGSRENDLILDFFSGSATTAHAVMKLNSEDDGNRKFICVQLPETTDEKSEAFKAGYKNICEIGKERIRRAGELVKKENAKDLTKVVELDIGFKVFKLDSSNIKAWDGNFENLEQNLLNSVDNIKSDRTNEDLLYEILLKYGLDLTLPMDELDINGKKVFSIGYGSLVVCLDDEITLETVEGIAKLKDESNEFMRVVFKDSGFEDSYIKTNAIEILKQHGIDEVKSV